jgi:tetratricopeptide (TPR) repeat protein
MWIYEAWTWLNANRKQVATGAAVVAVVGMTFGVMNHLRAQREFQASSALIELALKADPDPKAADYARVADEFGGTSAGERAALLAARALFVEGKYQEAQSRFEQYLGSHPDGLLRPTAMLGIAASLDALDQIEPALAAYQRVIDTFPNDPIAAQARMSMALIYETREPARAYKLYEEVRRATPPSPFAGDAFQKAEQLARKHPELKPAPASNPALEIPGLSMPLPAPDAAKDK